MTVKARRLRWSGSKVVGTDLHLPDDVAAELIAGRFAHSDEQHAWSNLDTRYGGTPIEDGDG